MSQSRFKGKELDSSSQLAMTRSHYRRACGRAIWIEKYNLPLRAFQRDALTEQGNDYPYNHEI